MHEVRRFGKGVGFAIWTAACILTLASAVFQRMTGPTYSFRGSYHSGGSDWVYRMKRNPVTDSPLIVTLRGPESATAQLLWREYPSQRPWKRQAMTKNGSEFSGSIPVQPRAGKVEYQILLDDPESGPVSIPGDGRRIVARYKDPVPGWALIPHIILMFTAMLVSNRLGMGLIFRENFRPVLLWITFVTLTVGGLVYGPIVQHYAFGAAWTGWPVGNDLTDNKSAMLWLAWLFPVICMIRGKECRRSTLAASFLTLAIYLIPHSMMGSQHHYVD